VVDCARPPSCFSAAGGRLSAVMLAGGRERSWTDPMRSGAEKDEAFVFGEVVEVLGVQGGEGQVVDQAAGGDPGVVLGSWPAAAGCVGGDLAPSAGDLIV
jgi:hypothetical protein